jgi:hypothetical protein
MGSCAMKYAILLLGVLVFGLIAPSFSSFLVYSDPNTYRDYDTFIRAFKSLADSNPSLITYESVGKTVQNRDILMFKIGNPSGGRVLFDGAIHGEESLAGELLYAYAKWLVTSASSDAQGILSRTYTLIIPALDADEYNNVRTNAHHVDLNRNFATNWQYQGSSDPESWYYRGPAPLSEPESQALIRVFNTYRPEFYINMHRGGSILYLSRYGNSSLYTSILNKVSVLSAARGVKPYSYQTLSGAGFAMSDAARMGITSFLLEIIEWDVSPSLSDIANVLLPRFLPIAIVLSQESGMANAVLFYDSFESGSFSSWNGTYSTLGDSATVSREWSYEGAFSAKFTTNGDASSEAAYCYETIPSTSEVFVQGWLLVEREGLYDNGDSVNLLSIYAGNEAVAYIGLLQSGGTLRWRLVVKDGSNSVTGTCPVNLILNRWYRISLNWAADSAVGYGELQIDDVGVCTLSHLNTGAYGNATSVRFGITSTYNCARTSIYYDRCLISNVPITSFPLWDIDQNGKVDMFDIGEILNSYGSTPLSANWNPRADVNTDGMINLRDVFLVVSHFGE